MQLPDDPGPAGTKGSNFVGGPDIRINRRWQAPGEKAMKGPKARKIALAATAAGLLALGASGYAGGTADHPPGGIDVSQSHVTVRVFKQGVFAGFAHNHEIAAPIEKAEIGASDPPSVTVEFASGKLKVEDPDGSAKERATVQANMLGPEVLDTQQYPEIRFHSTEVKAEGPGKWEVAGELSLHGQTHPVSFQVSEADGQYRGQAKLKQTEFGIKPIRIAGGAVKVKDEVVVEFAVAKK